MKRLAILLTILAVLGFGLNAQASLIWDYSPSLYGVSTPSYSNIIGGPHFAERITFGTDVLVTGMAIYNSPFAAVVGDSVTVSLWSDVSGHPGPLLTSFAVPISAVDPDGASPNTTRKYADFSTPISLSASTTYWMGMAGTTKDIGQASLASLPPGGDARMAYFVGASYSGLVGTMDMAFRLYSEAQPIPEPATFIVWSLLGVAGLSVGWWRRRGVTVSW